MEDVIIIGAGVAGLTAALALKHAGYSYRILEACDAPGGRARSRRLPSGVFADLGAHWLHGGQDNALKSEIDRYGLGYRDDRASAMQVYENGELRAEDVSDWLEGAIDPDKAERVRSGEAPDCPISDLARDADGRKLLSEFARMWNGVEPPMQPSAHEYLTDENTPGGLQIEGGMHTLIDRMVEEAGPDRIHLRTAVVRVVQTHTDGIPCVRIEAMDGSTWVARRAIFTASLGVLQSGMVRFTPGFSSAFHEHLAGMVMGKVNKIIVELDPAFVRERDIPVNMSIEQLDAQPPHFAHVHSAGQPLIQLYVSGEQAEAVEGLTPDEALAYVQTVLSPIDILKGFEAHVVSPPIATRWVASPYTRGSYSSCLPGARRSGPRVEGLVTFCGDTFDDRFPASMAGAYRSAQAGAQLVIDDLIKARESEPA